MIERFYVTVNEKPYGAAFCEDEFAAIRLAKQAKAEFPNADVVAWCDANPPEPAFEVWENGNEAGLREGEK